MYAATLKEKFTKLLASMPAGYSKGLDQKAAFVSKLDPVYCTIVRRAVGVEPTTCDQNTQLIQWLDNQLADWSNDAFYYAYVLDLYDVPFYYAYVFENTQADQTFGENGEYTHTLTKTFKDLKRFWNIQTNDIIIVSMHGSMLTYWYKLIKTYSIIYGLDAATAAAVSDFVIGVARCISGIQGRRSSHLYIQFCLFPSVLFPTGWCCSAKNCNGRWDYGSLHGYRLWRCSATGNSGA